MPSLSIITAPDTTTPSSWAEDVNIFLGGGITNCPNWQQEVIDSITNWWGVYRYDIVRNINIFNPRRTTWIDNPKAAKAQIKWEFERMSDICQFMTFWFPCETLCPITLFELGRWSYDKNKQLFVGAHPEYQRLLDIETQMELVGITNISKSVPQLTRQIINYMDGGEVW